MLTKQLNESESYPLFLTIKFELYRSFKIDQKNRQHIFKSIDTIVSINRKEEAFELKKLQSNNKSPSTTFYINQYYFHQQRANIKNSVQVKFREMMNGITIRRVYFNLSQLVSCLVIVQALLNITQGAPLKDGFHPIIAEKQQALEAISQPKVSNLAHVSSINDNSPTILNSKIKRDTNNAVKDAVKEGSSSSDHLDTQETGYLHNPAPYHTSDSDYGYDSGKNAYGKQASDWSQYDQGEFNYSNLMSESSIHSTQAH